MLIQIRKSLILSGQLEMFINWIDCNCILQDKVVSPVKQNKTKINKLTKRKYQEKVMSVKSTMVSKNMKCWKEE